MELLPRVDQPDTFRGCSCETMNICLRTISNGTRQYYMQCPRCGRSRSASKQERQRLAIVPPPYDEELPQRWQKQREANWRDRQERERQARLADLSDYYNTAFWRNKRLQVLKRDEFQCQACLAGCDRRASEVHHYMGYAHVGNEPLFELISVCHACHENITRMDRERRGVT